MAESRNFGSYQRYKEDTMVFLEWLASDAASSGCALPLKQIFPTPAPAPAAADPPTSNTESKTYAEKLREKAAKRASKREEKKSQPAPKSTSNTEQRSAPSLKVRIAETTNEILRQAKAVANNTKIQVPENVVKVVARAIRVRKRFAEWFSSNKIENGHSDDGHQHFIWILEEALRILKPRIPEDLGRKARTVRPITTPSYDLMSRLQRVLLENDAPVDETDDIEDLEDMEDILDEASNPPPNIGKAEQRTEIHSDSGLKNTKHDESLNTSDNVFAVYCFFEDLHRIQDFLKETWRSYGNQEIDLITASFTTNAALDIVRCEVEKLVGQIFPDDPSPEWVKVVSFISDNGYMGNFSEFTAESYQASEHDHFIYASVALVLGRLLRDFRTLPRGRVVPPFQWYYRCCPDRFKLPETEFLAAENRFLVQTIIDTLARSCLKKKWSGIPTEKPPGFEQRVFREDQISAPFTQKVDDFILHGRLDIPFVFTCRILLDVQEILEENAANGGRLLDNALMAADKTLDPQDDGERNIERFVLPTDEGFFQDLRWFVAWKKPPIRVEIEDQDRFNAEIAEKKKAAATRSHSWQALELPERRQKAFEEMTRVWEMNDSGTAIQDFLDEYESVFEDAQIMPFFVSCEMSFGVQRNPISCGNMLLSLNLKMERLHLSFANANLSIFHVAHLYNAVQQTGKLGPGYNWPEMDKMIDIHIKTIFSGQLPDHIEKCYRRLKLNSGYPIIKGKRLRMRKSCSPFGPQLSCTKASGILRKLYDDHDPISMERCLYLLNQQISKTMESKPNRAPHLSTVQFLRQIRDWLPAEIQLMQLDYWKLEYTCSQLLKRIRLTCLVELKVDHALPLQDLITGPRPSYQKYMIMVQDIVKEARNSDSLFQALHRHFKHRKNITEEEKTEYLKYMGERVGLPHDFIGAPQLKLVGKVLEKFLTGLKVAESKSASE